MKTKTILEKIFKIYIIRLESNIKVYKTSTINEIISDENINDEFKVN